ncbi:MAG: DUF2867 domain-containing protein [Acetobacteraceae bacterium]|nr:DUF2867 domain-containing protein [Acetobacteraceae bacterium]
MLVVGGSGFVGRHLVPHLVERGFRVRVLARNVRRAEAEGWVGVEILRGDATDRASLAPALSGVDVAYYLVHSMTAGKRFPDIDRTAAETFAASARAAGVRRIVYLGGLAPGDVDTVHLASRVETGVILRRNHPDVVEIRAGIIIGPGSAAFEVMRDLVANLPVMLTPRWVRSLSPPIALDDLLTQLEALATLEGVGGAVIETAGPDRLSYEEMMLRLADALGKRRPLIIRVPLLTPELSAYWIGLVTSTPASIARALITGLKHDLIANKDPRLEAVAPARIGFDEAVRRAFARERERLSEGRWREGAFDLRGMRHEVAYYGVSMRHARASLAPAKALWRSLERFGTRQGGSLALRPLWSIRRAIERLAGGEVAPPREAGPFRPGERFDVWRVHGVVPPTSLVLLSTLRAPGAGGFEFAILDEGGRRLVAATIHWHPRGFWGLLYWYVLAPFHRLVLASLTAAIVREAERNR